MKNFKSGHTTGQATRSNPNASEGVVDPRVRTSNLQGRRRMVQGWRSGEGGVESVAKR